MKSRSWPRDWVVRGRIPPDAAAQIRRAIEENPDRGTQRFIFKDWDAVDPAALKNDMTQKAFVEVFPKEVTDA